MIRKAFFQSVLLISVFSLMPGLSSGQVKSKPKSKELTPEELIEIERKAVRPPSGPVFYIAPIAEIPGRYSLVLTDHEGRHVSDSYADGQLIIFEAILTEAKKFAQTGESVGTTKPIITRFYDKKEPSFIVDVAKLRNISQFFITIKSLTGHLTVDAGSVKRGDEKSNPLLYTVLDRVQARHSIPND